MKNTDDDLTTALQSWQVTTALPVRFTSEVWKRIEQRRTISAREVLQTWFASVFARPVFALSYVAILLALGMGLGFKQAQTRSAQWTNELETRYVQAVNPYQRTSH